MKKVVFGVKITTDLMSAEDLEQKLKAALGDVDVRVTSVAFAKKKPEQHESERV